MSQPLVYTGGGRGDKTFDWALLFCMLVFSIVAAAIWSALDCKRANYTTLHKWFWVFIRFCLAGQMMIYGMDKFVPGVLRCTPGRICFSVSNRKKRSTQLLCSMSRREPVHLR